MYACISTSSTCPGVNSTDKDYGYQYIGYGCKCQDGFQGNPYVINGCQGSHKNYMHITEASTTYFHLFYWFFHLTNVHVAADIDECALTPGICRGLCRNTNGGCHCTECPNKTQYDSTVMQCTKEKKRKMSLLLGKFALDYSTQLTKLKTSCEGSLFIPGIIIGFGAGLGILLLGFCATLVVRRWRRHAQKKLWKKYFHQNTKAFSLNN
jgi:hypothetical protein